MRIFLTHAWLSHPAQPSVLLSTLLPEVTRCQEASILRMNEKTLEGTELALRSLTVVEVSAKRCKPCLLEQPRKSKMRRLEEWISILGRNLAEEQWTASCAFESTGLPSRILHRKCSRDHEHIRIQGSYTKASAVYTDQLAYALAKCFHLGRLPF
eukprot:s3208_g4.t1